MNHKVSQQTGEGIYKSPSDLIELAESKSVDQIAFTYNEPTIHYEYVIEVAQQFPVVIKTCGFANKWVIDDLASFCVAWNVDIKGDELEYQRICGGSISPVLFTIENLVSKGAHVEISYLVLPNLLKDFDHHRRIRDWLCNLDASIPVHLLYFYPFHNMTEEMYASSDLVPIVECFQEKLSNVYVSNSFDDEVLKYRNTHCSVCGQVMIERQKGISVIKKECCGLGV